MQLIRTLVAAGALAVPMAVVPAIAPAAHAASSVTARGVALNKSASCSTGDVDIDYAGDGIERQITTFSSSDGTTLHTYDVAAFAASYDGVEHVLSQTASPPAAGTLVAVHVSIGMSPPDPATTAEFFIAYTCDPSRTSRGGTNTVVFTCVGAYGTCPQTAQAYLALASLPPSEPASPVAASPAFSG